MSLYRISVALSMLCLILSGAARTFDVHGRMDTLSRVIADNEQMRTSLRIIMPCIDFLLCLLLAWRPGPRPTATLILGAGLLIGTLHFVTRNPAFLLLMPGAGVMQINADPRVIASCAAVVVILSGAILRGSELKEGP